MRIVTLFSRAGKQVVQNPSHAALLIRMAAWVSLLSLAVKFQSLPAALGLVATPIRKTNPAVTGAEHRLAATIDTLLKTKLFCFEPVCWKRAAVLHRYLALNGIATTIVFGMRKEADGSLHGHAWLESKGQPFLETEVPEYKVTYTFPSADKAPLDLEPGSLNSQ